MALISYVDDRLSNRAWKVERPIAVFRTIDEYLSTSVPGDVLIIHGGQADATKGSPSGRAMLMEALFRICQSGGRAVIFSGGQPMIAAPLLRQELERSGYAEGHHYLLLTAIQNLWHELDCDLLTTVQVTPEWPIGNVKRRHAAPVLLSLALLSQAALIAASPSELNDDVMTVLGGADAVEILRARCAPPSANALFTPQPWQAALGGRSSGEVLLALNKEWPAGGPDAESVRYLVTAVYHDQNALDASVVSRAYRDLCSALALNQEQQA